MRVAFDARSLCSPILRGWDRYTVGLVGELVRQGVEVSLFHRKRHPLHLAHLANLGCSVVGLPDFCGIHWEQVVVPRALHRGRFNIFHAPAEHGVPLASPCPVVLTVHSVTSDSYLDLIERGLLRGHLSEYLGDKKPNALSFASLYYRAQLHRASHVLTPSDFCRDEVVKFLRIRPSRVTTTRLAVHEQFLRPPAKATTRKRTLARLGVTCPYLLYVGGYEKHKNIEGLLVTFALVREAIPDLSLVIVGSKTLPQDVRSCAERLNLRAGKAVVFLVDIADELTDLYDDAELLVTLSWRESFCLPALEAMTRGVPVVVSAWGASSEVVVDGGELIDPRDHVAASRAILRILSSPDRSILVKQARSRASVFTWTETVRQTRRVYDHLLNGKSVRNEAVFHSRQDSGTLS